MLLTELGEPLMSSTLILPGDPQPLTHGLEIQERLEHEVDAVLDGGDCGIEPTTVVDLSSSPPVIVREGKGSLEPLIGTYAGLTGHVRYNCRSPNPPASGLSCLFLNPITVRGMS